MRHEHPCAGAGPMVTPRHSLALLGHRGKLPVLCLSAVMAASVCAAADAPLQTGGSRQMADDSDLQVTKVNLIVSNLERSLTIYRDALGFTVDYTRATPLESYSYPIFNLPKSARMRFTALSAGDQKQIISLTEVTGIDLGKGPAIATSATVIHVADLDGALRKLAAIPGVSMLPERPLIGPKGHMGREIAFVDPDGHRILLFRHDTDK
jgi:catechol 2,3-dioxygenase-like lactoylglutathione lyase family enzyme